MILRKDKILRKDIIKSKLCEVLNSMSLQWTFNIGFSSILIDLPLFTDKSERPKMLYMYRATVGMNLGIDLFSELTLNTIVSTNLKSYDIKE